MGGGRPDAGRSGAGAAGGGLPGMTSASTWFQRYLLPGFVFQAVVIVGGYATGRALVAIFLPAVLWGGLLGRVVSRLVWRGVLMARLLLLRVARAYCRSRDFHVDAERGGGRERERRDRR